jgi:hypothetical protein
MQARLHSFHSSFDYWLLPPAVVTPGDVLLAPETNQHGWRLSGYTIHG